MPSLVMDVAGLDVELQWEHTSWYLSRPVSKVTHKVRLIDDGEPRPYSKISNALNFTTLSLPVKWLQPKVILTVFDYVTLSAVTFDHLVPKTQRRAWQGQVWSRH